MRERERGRGKPRERVQPIRGWSIVDTRRAYKDCNGRLVNELPRQLNINCSFEPSLSLPPLSLPRACSFLALNPAATQSPQSRP